MSSRYDPFRLRPRHDQDFRHLVFVFVPTNRNDLRLYDGIDCLGSCRLDPKVSCPDPCSMRGKPGVAYRINLNVVRPHAIDEFKEALDRQHPRNLFLPNADSIIFQTNIGYHGSVEDYQNNPTTGPAHMHISKTGYAIRRLNYDTYDKKLLSLQRKH